MSHLDEGVRIQGFYNRSNLEVVDLPRRETSHGRPCDTVKVSEIGTYCAHKIAALTDREMFAEATLEMSHQIGSLTGSHLIDDKTKKELEGLRDRMERSSNPREIFNTEVRPAFYGLRPAPRKEGQ